MSAVLLAGGTILYRHMSANARSGGSAHPRASTPNVLLISIDMLRPDHLGCYGYQRNTSPHIDRLAAEGVLFENHISSTSWTLPAHAALFTSLSDSVHGCTDTDKKLSDKVGTLAEKFAQAGYRTVGFFSGPYLHPAFGLGRGFEHYVDCTSYAGTLDNNPVDRWAMDRGVMHASHRDITGPRVYEAFKKWFDTNGRSKFFMFVHMWDPHFDFIPPPPYDTMFDADYAGSVTGENFFFDPKINARMPQRDRNHLIALYDGEIAWTDMHVGKILDDLRAAGLLDNTIVAITSDHGTEFFEHAYKAHRMTLFDEVIRIPLIIRYPACLGGGVRIRPQTRIIDVAPTLLELAGVASMEDVMGVSLVPLALDPGLPFNQTAVSELFSVGRQLRSIRSPQWKLIDNIALKKRFYLNLTDDPAELHPQGDLTEGLGSELDQRYQATLRMLEGWRARISTGAEPSAIPDEVRKQLESLGYVGHEKP
jgi:arylsulfatase A-like enzyme